MSTQLTFLQNVNLVNKISQMELRWKIKKNYLIQYVMWVYWCFTLIGDYWYSVIWRDLSRDIFSYGCSSQVSINLHNAVFDLSDQLLHSKKKRQETWCRTWFLIQHLERQMSVQSPKSCLIIIRPLLIQPPSAQHEYHL